MYWRQDPDHRFPDQVAFLRSFPAYCTEPTGDGVILWYHGSDGVERLGLRAGGDGVWVEGAEAVARHVLAADAAPLPPEAALPADPPAHRWLRQRYGGIRPVRFAAPFEGISWAILGQQITVRQAVRLKTNLARAFGHPVETGTPLAVFPAPKHVAASDVEALRALQLSRQKAEALLGVARAMASHAWTPDHLVGMEQEAAVTELRRFRGIGRWTAEYVLLRVIGHPDAFPAADAGLQRAWARLGGRQGRASEDELRRAAEAWRGTRGDFAFALWLDNAAERAAGLGPLAP